MANFHSSTGAMGNLLIGLARGYWKERRKIDKRFLTDSRSHRNAVMELEDGFEESLLASCSGYYSEYTIKDIACNIIHGCEYFEEQRGKKK
jgi:hypothetical protein